jgi:taurine dioxygenase
MEFRPIHPALGLEATTQLDLRAPLAEHDRSALRDALSRSGVLLLRNQRLTPDEFVAFARGFGEIERYDSTIGQYLLDGRPEIIVLSNIVENGKPVGVADAGTYWHTDRSYVDRPAWSSCLYALEVPRAGDGSPLGDTEFASMIAAYRALPAEERAQLDRLYAWHEYVFRFSEKNDSMPGVRQPVVLRHPLSGEKCLYVNAGFTHRILDVPDDEGKALLEHLFEHAKRADFVYRHRWQEGDVLLWDNYSMQHRATGGYALPQRRLMWRTTIQGFPLQ